MLTVVLAVGCAHYAPKPLEPVQSFRNLESRTLSDEGLRAFIETNNPDAAEEWPRRSWDLDALTLVAFYYHPSLDVARAQVAEAEAGIVTAGGRPNPGMGLSPGRASNPEASISPWLLGLNFEIPVETAGKRGYRIARAKQLSEVAKLQLAETGWTVRSRVRAALLDYLLAQREVDLLHGEIDVRSNVVDLIESRFAVGDVSRPEVDAAKLQLVQARVALCTAEGRVNESRVELATALGLTPQAVAGVDFEWEDLERVPDPKNLSAESIQTTGLLNRLDVRRALAEYSATESGLQLEIAKQYPDVHILPGYEFDLGENKFTLGFSVDLPVFNQNQGPIAEAKAHREKAAAEFLALQARIIGELHKALEQYKAALAELNEVENSLKKIQDRTERLTQRALEIGETNRLALAEVQLQRIAVSRARLNALGRAQNALGALEDAVQRPLSAPNALPAVPLTIHRESGESR